MYSVVASVRSHPDAINPVRAIYQRRHLESLVQYEGLDIEAVSPRPYAPPVGPYSEFREIPGREKFDGYQIHHPRFVYLFPRRLFLTNVTVTSFRRTVTQFVENRFEIPEIVHAGHIFLDGYGLLPYCEKNDIPLTVMGRGGMLVNYTSYSEALRELVRETLLFSSAVICVSQDLADIASTIVDEPEKVHVVSNGIDTDRFPNESRTEIRKKLGIRADEMLVLFCGEYREHKGVEDIIDVLPEIDRPDTHFVFVGQEDNLKEDLEKAVAESSIGDKSSVLFRIDPAELAEFFVAADVFWLPSYPGEGRPNVVYEAMASKTPVLSTTAGGIPEQVADGETGYLITPGDVPALQENLRYLLEHPDERQTMGEAGFERLAELEVTWENHARKVSAIHREILG